MVVIVIVVVLVALESSSSSSINSCHGAVKNQKAEKKIVIMVVATV